MTHVQLTSEQRYQIKALLQANQRPTKIAEIIGVDRSTIYREIKRNTGLRGYRPKQAHEKALTRRQGKSKKRIEPETWELIEAKLRLDWSPEQIVNWFKKQGYVTVSHEWIYHHVYADKRTGGSLHEHLRCQKTYRKRTGRNERRGKIPHTTSIEQRPKIVEQRIRLGDWEVDLILGKGHQGVVVTLTERKSRFTLLRKVLQNRLSWLLKQLSTCSTGLSISRRSPLTTGKNSATIYTSVVTCALISFSRTLMHLGREAQMKTPIGSSGNICQSHVVSKR